MPKSKTITRAHHERKVSEMQDEISGLKKALDTMDEQYRVVTGQMREMYSFVSQECPNGRRRIQERTGQHGPNVAKGISYIDWMKSVISEETCILRDSGQEADKTMSFLLTVVPKLCPLMSKASAARRPMESDSTYLLRIISQQIEILDEAHRSAHHRHVMAQEQVENMERALLSQTVRATDLLEQRKQIRHHARDARTLIHNLIGECGMGSLEEQVFSGENFGKDHPMAGALSFMHQESERLRRLVGAILIIAQKPTSDETDRDILADL